MQRNLLVLKARPSGVVAATCFTGKGRADPSAIRWLVEQLQRLGLGRCILQADGEPAQRAFFWDVIDEVARTTPLGVAAAHSPPYDHQGNGDVERAIQELKGQVRTMRAALTKKIGQAAPVSRPAFDWLVEYAGELITGALVGRDGMTAYRRLRGRTWEPQLAEFGEQIVARG